LIDTTVFIQLPYDKSNPYKSLIDEWEDFAFSRNKNHSYKTKGNVLSGHWVVLLARILTELDRLTIENGNGLRLQQQPYVHPFATSITLLDKQLNLQQTANCLETSIGLTKVKLLAPRRVFSL
jgi:hypothetical protein